MAHWLFQEEHDLLRRSVRSWVEKEVKPHVPDWEEKGEFPRELFVRAGELGFLGLTFPEEYGGSGEDYLAGAVFVEEMYRCGSAGVAAGLVASAGIAAPQIYKFGSPELKERFLPPTIGGQKIGALAVSEPDAGSDVASIKTTARREGDYYLVNGSKVFITNGVRADYVVAAVKTDPAAGKNGISLLVVEKGTPGFSVARKLDKLGWHTSDTAELVFEDCRVPRANLVGQENMGFYYLMQNFVWERLSMALGGVVGAQLALEEAVKYAQQRVQFGRPLSKFQAIRHRLAEMAARTETARCLTYHALALFVSGQDAVTAVAMAKNYACETACYVTDEALQIHGGYGYMMEYPVQRLWRDARVGTIGGGTTEIMREIIAARLIQSQ